MTDNISYRGQDKESIIHSLNIGGEGEVPKLLVVIDLVISAALAPLVAIPLLMFYQYLEFEGHLGVLYWEILFWFIALCIAKFVFLCVSLIPADIKIWTQVGNNPHALWIASKVIDSKHIIAKHKHSVASYWGLAAIFLAVFFYYGGISMYMSNIHSVQQTVLAATKIQSYQATAQNYRSAKKWVKASEEFGRAANQAGSFDNMDDFSKSILLQIEMDKEQEKAH